jgi:Cu-Zn family superoxide dismutase
MISASSKARRSLLVFVAALALVGAGAVALAAFPKSAQAKDAVAKARLRLADGTPVGHVRFFDQDGATVVRVSLDVPEGTTAEESFHGFHIHANDDPTNGEGCMADPKAPSSTWFTSADDHLKAPGEHHGDHIGDLYSLYLNRDGTAHARFTIDRVDPSDLPGRAVVFHADPDNFANIPIGTAPDLYTPNSDAALAETRSSGNAGDRIACGVITAA